MPLAQPNTRGVSPATMNHKLIPEIGVAPDTLLNDRDDIHFGINIKKNDNPVLYHDFDKAKPREKDLLLWKGLGPRTLEIRRRGGRTAEHDFVYDPYGSTPTLRGEVRGFTGMNEAKLKKFNESIPIKNRQFPPGAKIGTADVGGEDKEYLSPSDPHATGSKYDAEGMEGGTRWSKTALEYALSRGAGKIHFHLTGMGELSGILDKTGDYGYNVTARELRYIRRWWMRFQDKVIFYNGYTSSEKGVIVYPPWLEAWEPDTATNKCRVCGKEFGLFTRHHHCRLCGKNVCDECSSHRFRLAYPVQRPGGAREAGSVRVCKKCFRPNAPSSFV